MAGQSKIGCITQRRFAKVGTKTHPQWGAALDRNGLSVSTETACRFEPKSPVGNSEICKLAWMWVRYQPDSALSCWFRQRVGSERGRTRRISIVALARKLLIALWRYVTHGEIPAGAVTKPV